MAVYPLSVEINEKNIEKVTRSLKDAYVEIVKEIDNATDFGVANRKAILRQIDGILSELGTDVNAFIEKEIPGYYKQGQKASTSQLNNINAPTTVNTAFNQLHKEAVFAMVDDTQRAFGEGLQGVSRSANLLLGRSTREMITQKMAQGVIGGSSVRDVRLMIKGILQEQGLSALVDRGGKQWSLDAYAEMLFRTKLVEARNRGLMNQTLQYGYDLVQVSSHIGSCPLCGPWQGQILSMSGDTPGYTTVATAEANGLFHPNCRHAINIIIPSLAKMTSAYDPTTKTMGPPGASAMNKEMKKAGLPKTTSPVVFTSGKKSTSFKVNEYERNLLDKYNVIPEINNRMKANGKFTATYSGDSRKILLRSTSQTPGTFFHEVGHSIDYLHTGPDIHSVYRANPIVADAIQKNRDAIYKVRAFDALKEQNWTKYNLTDDEKVKLSLGETVKKQIGTANGTPIYQDLHVNYKWRSYAKSTAEIFADGYSQYRTNPGEFKKYAPELFNIFETELK